MNKEWTSLKGKPEELRTEDEINKGKEIDGFPVYRSPKINWRCPLPTGKIASTTLEPVIILSFALALKDILGPRFKRFFVFLLVIFINSIFILDIIFVAAVYLFTFTSNNFTY